MVKDTVAVPTEVLDKFAKLAGLLGQASWLAREISRSRTEFKPVIPTLKRPDSVPADEDWLLAEDGDDLDVG